MADKKENNKPLIPPKAPRGNYQIWVILAAVAVIFGVMYMHSSSNLKEKTEDEFYRMVTNGDVQRVVLVQNRKFLEVTLTKEALNSAKYQTELNQGPLGSSTTGPHFVVKVVDAGDFNQEFRKMRETLPESKRPDYKPEEREDYFSVFLQWGFLFFAFVRASGC